jgi:hypothetical protein
MVHACDACDDGSCLESEDGVLTARAAYEIHRRPGGARYSGTGHCYVMV